MEVVLLHYLMLFVLYHDATATMLDRWFSVTITSSNILLVIVVKNLKHCLIIKCFFRRRSLSMWTVSVQLKGVTVGAYFLVSTLLFPWGCKTGFIVTWNIGVPAVSSL